MTENKQTVYTGENSIHRPTLLHGKSDCDDLNGTAHEYDRDDFASDIAECECLTKQSDESPDSTEVESKPDYISKTERAFGVVYRCHSCQSAADDWHDIVHQPGCDHHG